VVVRHRRHRHAYYLAVQHKRARLLIVDEASRWR